MKTNTNKMRNAECGMRNRNDAASDTISLRTPRSALRTSWAFTLIELLTVISIIAALAAFTVPVMSSVKRRQHISHTQAEMGQLQAAIESYKDACGFYPPDSPNGPLVNQLYYELEGTTFGNGTYTNLDLSDTVTASTLMATLGVNGIVNCSKGSAEDAVLAKNFIHELSPNQTAQTVAPNSVKLLVGSVRGPDANYMPLAVSGLNPWRYRSSGMLTNNPGAYELWIQLVIGGKTNLICNWSKTVQINSPLP
jgi:prepilin-type N-terminal cleavage/methylation domain-containing protein